MAKKKQDQTLARLTTPAAEATTTLSTRLAPEQKALIEDAAQLRSWTPSNLMRKAAVERSAHIVNTARQNQFDFASVASRLVMQLCRPELWVDEDVPGERYVIEHVLYDDGLEVKVSELSRAELDKIRDALHLGGVEFMEQVIAQCQARFDSPGLPAPVDPSALE